MLALVLAGLALGAFVASAQAALAPMRPGVVLVGFGRTTSAAERSALERAVGATGVRALGGTVALSVRSGREMADVDWLRRQRRLVRYAEPDYLLEASGARVPNDRSFSLQWGSLNTGQSVNGVKGTAGDDDGAAKAWNVTTGSPSIVIAEVDTGVDYTHPDLAANVWSNPGGVGGCPRGTHGYNVVAGTCYPMDDDTVYNGHGTHVAGIMGAVGNNGTGVAGMNWRTTILPVKWLDAKATGTTAQLLSALNWVSAAKKAGVNIRVVNDSATFVGTAYSQALSDEIDLLGSEGVLFVTAAGNTSQNDDDPSTPRYPCDYDRPTEVCVTASDQHDQMPSWANWGPHTVDLAAPGDEIYSTLRVAAGSYGYINGASMSAAQVSGAAGLILSAVNLSTTALKADILGNVDPLASLFGKVRTSGRLDVCKALPGCEPPPPPPPPPPVARLVARAFSATPRRMVVSIHGARRTTKGIRFRFWLSEPASVRIVIQRRVAGRRVRGRCLAGGRAPAHAARCTAYARVMTINVGGAQGSNAKAWRGRVGRRILVPGTYRALMVASRQGATSRTETAAFAVVDRHASR